jgi:hypothetical protein
MSLHAELSPEALARLHAQKRNSTISSIIISCLVIALMLLLFAIFALPQISKDVPTIVTYSASLNDDDQIQQKKVNNTLQRKPSSPSSTMAKVIAANTASPTAVPVPDVEVTTPSTDFGDAEDFGSGWGDGGEGGFGNIPPVMRKRCSKEDRMQRLADTGGTPECETAVEKGLEWLKATQSTNGSWTNANQAGMTGLALLAYLGRCETPTSEKYGDSVLRAITYLVNLGLKNKGKLTVNAADKHWPYEHSIAAYALAEASTFCKQLNINVPNLHEVTRMAGQLIIDNQHDSGGWDYSYDTKGSRGGDLSIAAWHLQALKALYHTGLEVRGLTRSANRGVAYVEKMQNRNGGFGYSSPNGPAGNIDYFSMTGGGVLSLQMWDKGAQSAARNGARYIEQNTKFEYNTQYSDLYGHYYEAQVMMNRGGEQWKKYNAMFRDQLLKNQNADGSWKAPGGGKAIRGVATQFVQNTHYRTCLNILMLEVYYRFLPGTGAGVK